MRMIFLVAVLIFASMLVIKDGRFMHKAGLTGWCGATAPPEGRAGDWMACHQGRLDGRPNLSKQGCHAHGVAGRIQYWSCPAPIAGALGT
jgi:hypothetical protein